MNTPLPLIKHIKSKNCDNYFVKCYSLLLKHGYCCAPVVVGACLAFFCAVMYITVIFIYICVLSSAICKCCLFFVLICIPNIYNFVYVDMYLYRHYIRSVCTGILFCRLFCHFSMAQHSTLDDSIISFCVQHLCH